MYNKRTVMVLVEQVVQKSMCSSVAPGSCAVYG